MFYSLHHIIIIIIITSQQFSSSNHFLFIKEHVIFFNLFMVTLTDVKHLQNKLASLITYFIAALISVIND